MYFITETDKASDFFILSGDYTHRIRKSETEEKQTVKTDCFVKS